MKEDILIRKATLEDCENILSIYKHYVENTVISFEYDTPTKEEFLERIKTISKKYPYLVALKGNKIVGYAYAGVFKERSAYARCVELSIYLDKNYIHQGIGRKLYEQIENLLKEQGFLNLYAYITYPDKEDEYADFNSIEFHKHLGFEIIGKYKQCGYKFNRWYNLVCMEKLIGEHC